MHITNSNVSFNGSFLINYGNTPKSLRQGFEETVKGKITFDNFGGENRILYVLKDSKDYETANFIKTHNLRFVYYPDMNTKLRFEPNEPEVVRQYIKDNNLTSIRNKKDLTEYIAAYRTENRAIPDSNKSFHQKLSDKLILNIYGKPHKDSRGVTIVRNENGVGFFKMSPWSPNGISYVYVQPANSYDDVKRYAIDKELNVLATYNSPEGIQQFHKNFKDTIRAQCQKKNID